MLSAALVRDVGGPLLHGPVGVWGWWLVGWFGSNCGHHIGAAAVLDSTFSEQLAVVLRRVPAGPRLSRLSGRRGGAAIWRIPRRISLEARGAARLTFLRLAAVLAPLLSEIIVDGDAFYVDERRGAPRACGCGPIMEWNTSIATPYYPWDCAWESAASLCARLAGGCVCAPLFCLRRRSRRTRWHCRRRCAAEVREEAAPKALVDDANDLWRPASAVWFLACAGFYDARRARRVSWAGGARLARAARSRRRGD